MRYAYNGASPSCSSGTLYDAEAPPQLVQTTSISAIACGTSLTKSSITANHQIEIQAAQVQVTAEGTGSVPIVMAQTANSAADGFAIRYALGASEDGFDAILLDCSEVGNTYDAASPPVIQEYTLVKAIACGTSVITSDVVAQAVTVQAYAPSVSPDDGVGVVTFTLTQTQNED